MNVIDENSLENELEKQIPEYVGETKNEEAKDVSQPENQPESPKLGGLQVGQKLRIPEKYVTLFRYLVSDLDKHPADMHLYIFDNLHPENCDV